MNTDDRYVKNEAGKVLYYDGLSGKAYPYRWHRNCQKWVEASGMYKLSYIKTLERMGLLKFFWDR